MDGRRSNPKAVCKLIDYLAERVRPPWRWTDLFKPDHRLIGSCVMQAGLSMVVWILKREVVGSTPTRPTIAKTDPWSVRPLRPFGALAQLGER